MDFWAKTRGRSFRIAMLLTIVFIAIKSESATSLLVIALFVGLGTAIEKLRVKGILIAAPVALAALLGRDLLIEMLGKDPTLTGRTEIWAAVIPDIWQRPLVGWGYAAFWTTDNSAAWEISNALHWWVPQAHNGVLEILLSAGLVGAIVYVSLLARAFRMSTLCMRTDKPALGVTSFLSCVGIVLTGVSENVLIYPSAPTVVFLITLFCCERTLWEARRRQFSSPPPGARRRAVLLPGLRQDHPVPLRGPASLARQSKFGSASVKSSETL